MPVGHATKNIGFRRNIFRPWLDAAAALRVETDDAQEIRTRLDPIVAEQISSDANRRMALDILINIWVKNADDYPALFDNGLELYAHSTVDDDRLWLHYGMTTLAYAFFRQGVAAVGQLSRIQDSITLKELRQRLTAELGDLGSLANATERILFSIRNWGILVDTEKRNVYAPRRRAFPASSRQLEAWMLAVVLTAHPREELTFPDLMRLPELFPFAFSITVDELRLVPWFAVQRQGAGWDMVRLTDG